MAIQKYLPQKKLLINFSFSFYAYLSYIFPLRLWLFLGKILGMLFYIISKKRRNIALANLAFVFPDKKKNELKKIAQKSFQEFGMIFQEYIKLKYTDIKDLKEFIEPIGLENIQKAKVAKKGVILLSAHFGNWEYALRFYASTINKINFLVRKIDNPQLEKIRKELSEKFNINTLCKDTEVLTAAKNLKKGEDLFLLPDQSSNLNEGINSLFFGKKTITMRSVPKMAKNLDVPVVPVFIVRQKNITKHKIFFLPKLNFKDSNGKHFSLEKNIQLQNDTIEDMIKKYPTKWLWFHKKWSNHPEIYK